MPIKDPAITQLAEQLDQQAFKRSPKECYQEGICVSCGEPAAPKCHTAAGRREYKISTMCEECFDKLFAD